MDPLKQDHIDTIREKHAGFRVSCLPGRSQTPTRFLSCPESQPYLQVIPSRKSPHPALTTAHPWELESPHCGESSLKAGTVSCVTCSMRNSPGLPRWSILNPVSWAPEVTGQPLHLCKLVDEGFGLIAPRLSTPQAHPFSV